MMCFYYFGLYKVETGGPQMNINLAKALTLEQGVEFVSRWKNDMIHMIWMNMQDNVKTLSYDKVPQVVQALAMSIAKKEWKDFLEICFRMTEESKKKRKILYQTLHLKKQLADILPNSAYDKMYDYLKDTYERQGNNLNKDPYLFDKAGIKAEQVLKYFLELNAEMDVSYVIDRGETLDKILTYHQARRQFSFKPSQRKKIDVRDISVVWDNYHVAFAYEDKAIDTNSLQSVLSQAYPLWKANVLKQESTGYLPAAEQEEMMEHASAYYYHAILWLKNHVISTMPETLQVDGVVMDAQRAQEMISQKYNAHTADIFLLQSDVKHVNLEYIYDEINNILYIQHDTDVVKADLSQHDKIDISYYQKDKKIGMQQVYVSEDAKSVSITPYTLPQHVVALQGWAQQYGVEELFTKEKLTEDDEIHVYLPWLEKITRQWAEEFKNMDNEQSIVKYLLEQTSHPQASIDQFLPEHNNRKKQISAEHAQKIQDSPERAHMQFLFKIYKKLPSVVEKKRVIDEALKALELEWGAASKRTKLLEIFAKYKSNEKNKQFYKPYLMTLWISVVPGSEVDGELHRLQNKLSMLKHRYSMYNRVLTSFGIQEITEQTIEDTIKNKWQVFKKHTQELAISLEDERRAHHFLMLREQRKEYSYDKLFNIKFGKVLNNERSIRIGVLYEDLKKYNVFDFLHSPRASVEEKAPIRNLLAHYINYQIRNREEEPEKNDDEAKFSKHKEQKRIISRVDPLERKLRVVAYKAFLAIVDNNKHAHAEHLQQGKELLVQIKDAMIEYATLLKEKKKMYKKNKVYISKTPVEKRLEKYYDWFPLLPGDVLFEGEGMPVSKQKEAWTLPVKYSAETYREFLFNTMYGATPKYVQKYLDKWPDHNQKSEYRTNYIKLVEYTRPILFDLPYINDEYADHCLAVINEKKEDGGVKKAAQWFLYNHLKDLVIYLVKNRILEDFLENYLTINDKKMKKELTEWIRWYVKKYLYTKREQVAHVGSYEYHLAQRTEFLTSPSAEKIILHGNAKITLPVINESRLKTISDKIALRLATDLTKPVK